MSERDSVHKEIEKLQEEIKEKNKKLASHEGRNKHYDDEVNKQLLTFCGYNRHRKFPSQFWSYSKFLNFFFMNAILSTTTTDI